MDSRSGFGFGSDLVVMLLVVLLVLVLLVLLALSLFLRSSSRFISDSDGANRIFLSAGSESLVMTGGR